jgi:hypothetical protein
MKRGSFCAVCTSSKTEKAANSHGVINNNYIIDVYQSTIREANFFFDKEFNDYQIDYMNFGQISMFRTFKFADGKALKTPVYYISN